MALQVLCCDTDLQFSHVNFIVSPEGRRIKV